MKKTWTLRLTALTLLLAVLLCACGKPAEEAPEASVSAPASAPVVEEEPVIEPEMLIYPGFTDQTFTAGDTLFAMNNSQKSAAQFTFELTDSKGRVLFTSDPVEPGDCAYWSVTNRWHSGQHRLTIRSTPTLPDGTVGNSVTQTIKVTLNLE